MKRTTKMLTIGVVIISNVFHGISQETEYDADFYEFVTQFSQNRDTQIESIIFPLTIVSDNETSIVKENAWETMEACFGCEFSSILFMGDSIDSNSKFYKKNLDNYVISTYIMPVKKIQNFIFKKIDSNFYLRSIDLQVIRSQESESFFDFIDKFALDTNFIAQRLIKDAKYITWENSPDELITLPIDLNFFENDEYLFKKIYINNLDTQANNVILLIKGEDTGYHTEYYFERINGKWFLTKLVNTGI